MLAASARRLQSPWHQGHSLLLSSSLQAGRLPQTSDHFLPAPNRMIAAVAARWAQHKSTRKAQSSVACFVDDVRRCTVSLVHLSSLSSASARPYAVSVVYSMAALTRTRALYNAADAILCTCVHTVCTCANTELLPYHNEFLLNNISYNLTYHALLIAGRLCKL
jgi:hypothetical protein